MEEESTMHELSKEHLLGRPSFPQGHPTRQAPKKQEGKKETIKEMLAHY